MTHPTTYQPISDWDTLQFTQFITLCTHECQPLFGLIRLQRHHQLWTPSPWGQAVIAGLEAIQEAHEQALLEDFVVMPNHIHMIALFRGCDRRLSHNFVTYCKHFLAQAIRDVSPTRQPVWAKSFHAQTIHSTHTHTALSESIRTHHERWPYDSLYCSSHPTLVAEPHRPWHP